MESQPERTGSELSQGLFAPLHRLPKRTQNLLALLVIVAVLAAAYFIGAAHYYRVHPLGTDSGLSEDSPYGSKGYEARYRVFLKEFDLAKTMSCDSEAQYPRDNELYTEKVETKALCGTVLARKKLGLEHIGYLGTNSSVNPVGVATFDLAGKRYLLAFRLELTTETGDFDIHIEHIAELKDTREVSSLAIATAEDVRLIKLTGLDAQGNKYVRYLNITSGYSLSYGTPVYRNDDGSYSQRIISGDTPYYDSPATVAFLVPFLESWSEQQADRDTALEKDKGIVPIYHEQGCDLEDTYADVAVYFQHPKERISVFVQTGYYAKLNITGPRYGYAPEEWGRVLEQLSPAQFQTRVIVPGARNSKAPTRLLNLSGSTVKELGPLDPDEGCDYYNHGIAYQYQAAAGPAVVTIVFSRDPQSESLSAESREKIVAEVIRTLNVTPK